MPLNFVPYAVFDFECGSRNPETTQVTQLAAMMLDPRDLTLRGTFNSEIRAYIDDDEAIAKGLDPLEDDALRITGKTREDIDKAPELTMVWKGFTEWVQSFNKNNNMFTAPIPVGYNINNFDLPIIERLSEQFGQWNHEEGRSTVFNVIRKVDMMDELWTWTESNPKVKSLSMDNVRTWMGYPEESLAKAHDGLQDVKDVSNLFIRFLKYKRHIATTVKFEGCFSNGEMYIK